jgi:hypothetical protein
MAEEGDNGPDPRIREVGAGGEWVSSAPRADAGPVPPEPEPDDEFDPRRREQMMPRPEDARHLDLLATFYFVVAGLTALCGSIPIIHIVLGISILSGGLKGSGSPPPASAGGMFVVMGSVAVALMWGLAVCMLMAGFCLRRRRGYVFCLVVAGMACLNQPFGVVLGVFTFILLLRPRVKTLFDKPNQVLG